MDHQNILFLGCLTLALAISAFILWGPSPRPKKKKGHIVGLVNLGSTCFLNTLLQALASCAIFVQWLMQQKTEENTLTSSLCEVLWVLNGEGQADTHAPVEVLSALKRHGWMVPSGEQDAHELFHIIISTLQDENKKVVKPGSLSDALPVSDTLSQSSDILDDNFDLQPDEAVKSGFCLELDLVYKEGNKIKDHRTQLFAQGDSESENPIQKVSYGDSSFVSCEVDKAVQGDSLPQSSPEKFYSLDSETGKDVKKHCGDVEEQIETETATLKLEFNDAISKGTEFLSVQNPKTALGNNTPKFKTSQESIRERSPNFRGCYDRATGYSLVIPQLEAPPFQGLLKSTLQCSACGYYSSLHYDTFDSLSLPLGESFQFQVLKLEDLLRRFVKTEIIPDVECEKCCKKTTALKTMNFGKLPACLCLHIARTTWQSYSHTPTKRDDFVDFPEYLPMDEYTVSARLKKTGSVASVHSLNSESSISEEKTYKHMYRLKSVVVHLGDVSSGHFLTYRRGTLNSIRRHRIGKLAGACRDSMRWYLTSDDNVKLSTLCEAMESLAYMLFYEKCFDTFPIDDEPKE